LLQRVTHARVTVEGTEVGTIGRGLLILLGVTHDDRPTDASMLAHKSANLRLFDDESGTMNRSALDLVAAGEAVGLLVVSQFTLYGDARRGRRPSYVRAAPPAVAAPLVERFVADIAALGLTVATGRFGAEMAVELVNDGPVTLWLDSAELRR
jgi:D-tyrosyl-tRNA(Tyr) deacylase